MAETFGDKSHPATPYRRQKAREEGHVAKSQDLASAIVLLGSIAALFWLGSGAANALEEFFRRQFGEFSLAHSDAESFVSKSLDTFLFLGNVLLPFFGVLLVIAIASHVIQTGWILIPQRAVPDANRIHPIKGLQRIFSMTNTIQFLHGVAKIAVVGSIAFFSVRMQFEEFLQLGVLPLPEQCAAVVQLLLSTAFHVAAALTSVAILDYAYQRWRYEQDLRMTTQELREEHRQLQANPQLLSKRKQMRRQWSQDRIDANFSDADLVLENQNGDVIALQYRPSLMAAPVVTAKGSGGNGKRICSLATKAGIPVFQGEELVTDLYRRVKVQGTIPSDRFHEVANLIQWAYQSPEAMTR